MSFSGFGVLILVVGMCLWVSGLEHAGFVVIGVGVGISIVGLLVRRRLF